MNEFNNTSEAICRTYYFADNESTVYQMIDRVATAIGVYANDAQLRTNLLDILHNRRAWFNSPVWFNIGVHTNPQVAACYLLDVRDDMDSIMNFCKRSARVYKRGSGAGLNLSPIRGKIEPVNGGGHASGAVSFMRIYDAVAGQVQSGGKTRRAALMCCLNANHPDARDFIIAKALEEIKANQKNLTRDDMKFQNLNMSVRVNDNFMKAVELNVEMPWGRYVTTGKEVEKSHSAPTLFRLICEAARECGDPALLFHDAINRMNTCAEDFTINTVNPCGEYHFVNNSVCNLASLNLLQYYDADNDKFDLKTFEKDIDTMIESMDVLVDVQANTSLVDDENEISENCLDYRPLGLGYTNLGALLMQMGYGYGTLEARKVASFITSFMTLKAYQASLRLAERKGAYRRWKNNKYSHTNVLEAHKNACYTCVPSQFEYCDIKDDWNRLLNQVQDVGLRNAQVTLLAPTGTISLAMGCETFGIEPFYRLETTKHTVNGEVLTFSCKSLEIGLQKQRDDMEILAKTANDLTYLEHIEMMCAVQPHLSGAISKTINMSHNIGTDDVKDAFMYAWNRGLKGITIYRDGSKRTQPLNPSPLQEQNLSCSGGCGI